MSKAFPQVNHRLPAFQLSFLVKTIVYRINLLYLILYVKGGENSVK
jgi:hypothetical protein